VDPDRSRRLRIGVVVEPDQDHLGAWLADATAYEAAGADALWLQLGADSRLDPLALTAALSAVTYRTLVVTSLPGGYVPSRALTGTLSTLTRLSRGRLRVLVDAVALLDDEQAQAVPGFFRAVAGEPGGASGASGAGGAVAFDHLREPDPPQRWTWVSAPDGRAGWRSTVEEVGERGFAGVFVPAGPRLLDILRNPDDPGERRDLDLAQG
jgi:hypothetical protein